MFLILCAVALTVYSSRKGWLSGLEKAINEQYEKAKPSSEDDAPKW